MSAARSLSFAEVVTDLMRTTTLETKLTDPAFFALTTASPLQRAICRVADGQPLGDLAGDPIVMRALKAVPPRVKPREFVLLSGIRTGKSLIAAAMAFHWSQTCDVTALGPGEVPRVSIVSYRKDLADVIFGHVVGRMQASPVLKTVLLGDPVGDAIMVRHPSGRPVEIKVVAGARAGSSLVARWSAGCIFDEFPRMVGGDDGVINWDDSRDAVLLRLLPGTQLAHVGSPWRPYGPAYELVQKHWGSPTRDLVVVKAPAPDMNPAIWTPEAVALAMSNPDVYRTDVLGEFATPEEALFSAATVEAATRESPEVAPRDPLLTYTAAIDPATRGNGWTLIVATRRGRKKIVAGAWEWRGSREKPLNPDAVLQEIAVILRQYGITWLDSDQHMGDALTVIARQHGLSLLQQTTSDKERTDKYLAIRTRLDMGEVELPPVPQLRTDLLHLRKRVTQTGVSIVLPLTADGRHADFAPALMLAMSRYLDDVAEEKPPSTLAMDDESRRARDAINQRFKPRENW